jgi:hypothetical protein
MERVYQGAKVSKMRTMMETTWDLLWPTHATLVVGCSLETETERDISTLFIPRIREYFVPLGVRSRFLEPIYSTDIFVRSTRIKYQVDDMTCHHRTLLCECLEKPLRNDYKRKEGGSHDLVCLSCTPCFRFLPGLELREPFRGWRERNRFNPP